MHFILVDNVQPWIRLLSKPSSFAAALRVSSLLCMRMEGQGGVLPLPLAFHVWAEGQ